jgi:hypothetical protein
MTEGQTEQTNKNEGISEDELKGLISTSLDEKLEERGITKEVFEKLGKLDILDSLGDLFEKNKSEPVDKQSLLSDIGNIIDEKFKGVSTSGSSSGGGNSGTNGERIPRLKIFG